MNTSLNQFIRSMLIAFSVAVIFGGCKSRNTAASTEKDVVVDRKATNVALIMGTPSNLVWADGSMKAMAKVFGSDLADQNFTVKTVVADTPETMQSSIRDAASQVGDNGTLVLTFAQHGSQNGYLQAENFKLVSYIQLARSVVENRKKPIRRTIFLIESCYSGSATPIATNDHLTNTINTELLDTIDWYNSQFAKQQNWQRFSVDKTRMANSGISFSKSDNDYFGQVFVFMSSTPQQESWGDMNVGYFTDAFRKSVQTMHDEYRENATFNRLADAIRTSMQGQQSLFIARPSEVGDDLVFDQTSLANFQGAPQNTPDNAAIRQKVAHQWNADVAYKLYYLIKGCSLTVNLESITTDTFFFDPTYTIKDPRGKVLASDAYFGSMNWMSDPSVSAEVIKSTLVSGKNQFSALGCLLQSRQNQFK